MQHAANRASMSHDMATTSRGRISPAGRGHRAWPPGNSRINGSNAFEEPEDFMPGSHGMVGANDPDNAYEYDDSFDGGRSDC
jgi:hypothetical protein